MKTVIAIFVSIALAACATTNAAQPTDQDMKWAAATTVRPGAPAVCGPAVKRPRLAPKNYSDAAAWDAYWKLDAYTARLEGRHAACGTWARGTR